MVFKSCERTLACLLQSNTINNSLMVIDVVNTFEWVYLISDQLVSRIHDPKWSLAPYQCCQQTGSIVPGRNMHIFWRKFNGHLWQIRPTLRDWGHEISGLWKEFFRSKHTPSPVCLLLMYRCMFTPPPPETTDNRHYGSVCLLLMYRCIFTPPNLPETRQQIPTF